MYGEDVAAINIIDVFTDFSLTGIISTFVPCYTLGKNAEAVSENCLLCGLSHFIWPLGIFAHVTIRGKIREQKGIEVCTQCLYPGISLHSFYSKFSIILNPKLPPKCSNTST